MSKNLFVNLPVKDLKKSIDFFEFLGFSFNPQFSDDKAACLILGVNLFAMLITEPYFKTFTKKEICNADTHTEVLIAIDVDSREAVGKMVADAVKAGGSTYMDVQDQGWMYQHSFEDLDGHQWEVLYMDETQIPQEENADKLNS